MNEIGSQIGPTWNGQNISGGAVPGTPDSLATSEEIAQYLDYVAGGYSGVSAGFPSAFGYQTPGAGKVYLSPNMSFDFTLIEWGIPVGNPPVPVPVPLTAVEAEQYWQSEYDDLMAHASQPITQWPWHDYGPTTSADPITGVGYSFDMYENTIAMAFSDGAEFVTSRYRSILASRCCSAVRWCDRRTAAAQISVLPVSESRRHRMYPPGITRGHATLRWGMVCGMFASSVTGRVLYGCLQERGQTRRGFAAIRDGTYTASRRGYFVGFAFAAEDADITRLGLAW